MQPFPADFISKKLRSRSSSFPATLKQFDRGELQKLAPLQLPQLLPTISSICPRGGTHECPDYVEVAERRWSRAPDRGGQQLRLSRSRVPPLPTVTPQVFNNPNSRSTQLTVVKSRSTWALTSKNSLTYSMEPFWLLDTLVGPTHGQRLGQTPLHP
jgi:hypothetical protein